MIAGIKAENASCDLDHAPFRVVCHPKKLGFDIVYLSAKFDDSSFIRSRDITGEPQNVKLVT